jgi:UDP-galactopyranose mutase
MYEMFFRGYSTKQWGVDPSELPACMVNRMRLHLDDNDRYTNQKYSLIPSGGYGKFFKNMLLGIRIQSGIKVTLDFIQKKQRLGYTTFFTGALDKLFENQLGQLRWRSMKFEMNYEAKTRFGRSVTNYADIGVEHVRAVEHKFLVPRYLYGKLPERSLWTREVPCEPDEIHPPMYPLMDGESLKLQALYQSMCSEFGIVPVGRLAQYKYMTMSDAVGAARSAVEKTIKTR